MNRSAGSLVAAVLCAALAPIAQAQRTQMPSPSGMDCKALAGIPNAPMTVESCEQMMKTQMDLMSALNTPGGERPGDEQMSCAQIIEEMKTTKASGVSPGNAAEGKAAAEDLKGAMQRAQAEAAALAAVQTARNMAAAAVPGNAPGQANAMLGMAEQKALQDKASAQINPARERLVQANANSMADLARSMRENPRFARLMQLTMQRGCTG